MQFTDDFLCDSFREPPHPDLQKEQMQQEIKQLAAYRSLRFCRAFFLISMLLLAFATTIGSNHMPVSLSAILCYLFVSWIMTSHIEKKASKKKWHKAAFPSLCHRYLFSVSGLMTERYCFLFSFFLLLLLQYAYTKNMQLNSLFLTFAPSMLAISQLLLYQLGTFCMKIHIRKQLLHPER